MLKDFEIKLKNCDISLYTIKAQMSDGDKKSSLFLQNIIRETLDSYTYLELGSNLGGSLVPYLLDKKCKTIYSVDKRPLKQPDERGTYFYYDGNSTERMIETLKSHISIDCLDKLQTFDMDSSELTKMHITIKPDLIFIDAEHTNAAAFRDFLNVYKLANESSIIIFHDAQIVYDSLINIDNLLDFLNIKYQSLVLDGNLWILLLNDFVDIAYEKMSKIAKEKTTYISVARQRQYKEIVKNNKHLVNL